MTNSLASLQKDLKALSDCWQGSLEEVVNYFQKLDDSSRHKALNVPPSTFRGWRYYIRDPQTNNRFLDSIHPDQWFDLLMRATLKPDAITKKEAAAILRMNTRLEGMIGRLDQLSSVAQDHEYSPFTPEQIQQAKSLALSLRELHSDLKNKNIFEQMVGLVKETSPGAMEYAENKLASLNDRPTGFQQIH